MEALQQVASVRSCSIGAAAVVDCAASSNFQPLARASLGRKSVACQGVSTSASLSSFTFNSLASKVPAVESGKKGCRGVVTMRADTAAGGYASALAELAQGGNILDAIYRDVEILGDMLKNKEVFEFLSSPIVVEEKKKSILKTFADDAKFHDYTLNFLYILIDKKRFGLINDICKEFSGIYYELTETQLATVISAVKIEKAQLALIAKKIQSLSNAKNVRIKNEIDPTLIAGFKVKFGKDGSRSVDLSVKGQLDKISAQFEYAEKAGAY
ncbi:F-type H+-transporting ATPase subunit delta [Marchantia polymorpha subsp. ruderalis]|uniref:Uncharacterized protein n=2 Tax=Marchantia polymorpha TaxID=3197 RepID=A0AAF6AXT7_MARPO|nr:hypothetical protein MARPO_0006s0050 [Marchantia polymorpha]BBN04571.1 hypothetical protein Mp_3g05790 [Marchantia polymorpha subsp. ruderalis]|eukprot:PTQ48008.1 hypothetical protein MARPO_0006s0050 [Marchantia polymorpha]